MQHKVIIGCPFGNYWQPPNCIHTLGTFTAKYRGSFPYRIWRCLRTLRPLMMNQGWTNKLGLPNPGMNWFFKHHDGTVDLSNKIISIHGFDHDEWRDLSDLLTYTPWAFEANFSCPNVGHLSNVAEATRAASLLLERLNTQPLYLGRPRLICKLSPIRWMTYVDALYTVGIRWFHLTNTLPTPGGGISGKPLTPLALWAVDEVRQKYPDVTIIGGGGIYDVMTAIQFLENGANHVSVASALLNPFRWKLPTQINNYLFKQGLSNENVHDAAAE